MEQNIILVWPHQCTHVLWWCHSENSHLTRHDAMAMCLYMEIVTQNVYHHRQTRFNGNARAKCTYTEVVKGVVNWGSRLRVQSESKKIFAH